jgi:hypothetical protein
LSSKISFGSSQALNFIFSNRISATLVSGERMNELDYDSDGSEFTDEEGSDSLSSSSSFSDSPSSSASLTPRIDYYEFDEVPDPFHDYCPGPDASELDVIFNLLSIFYFRILGQACGEVF